MTSDLAELIAMNVAGDIGDLASQLETEAQRPTGPNGATVALIAHKMRMIVEGVESLPVLARVSPIHHPDTPGNR